MRLSSLRAIGEPSAARVLQQVARGEANAVGNVAIALSVRAVALRLEELHVAAPFGDRDHVVARRAQRGPRRAW